MGQMSKTMIKLCERCQQHLAVARVRSQIVDGINLDMRVCEFCAAEALEPCYRFEVWSLSSPQDQPKEGKDL